MALTKRFAPLALLPALLLVLLLFHFFGAARSDQYVIAEAVRRDFLNIVSTKGNLEPVQEEAITALTWGIISEMWPDGKPVKAGEIVLRIDDTEEKERLEREGYDLEMTRADLERAEERAKREVKDAERSVNDAQTALEAAQLELAEIEAGPDPDELASAQETYKSSVRIHELRKEEYRITSELAEAGYVSADELKNTETAVKRALIQAEKARINLDKIVKGPDSADIRAVELAVKTAQLNLESARRRLESVQSTTEADLERRRNNVRQREIDIERRTDLLKFYTCAAPIDGVVMHAPGRWGTPWQPGRFVWKGFKVLSIPDFSRMKVTTPVPENEITMVRVGARSLIHLPSLPESVFHGTVNKITELAKDEFDELDQYSKDMLGRAERRVFTVEIEIEEKDPALRAGLTAIADIIVTEVKDAVVIPLAALTYRDEQAFVRILTADGEVVQRKIIPGPFNETYVVVKEGLDEHQRVIMSGVTASPPPALAKEMMPEPPPAPAPAPQPEERRRRRPTGGAPDGERRGRGPGGGGGGR